MTTKILFQPPSQKKLLLVSLFLLVTTLAIYWPILHHGFINYDDGEYVTENTQVLGGLTLKGVAWAFTTGTAANWHPLTWLSHMLDVELYGLRPGGHHFTSLILHLVNSLLLFFLLKRLTALPWRSAIVAALFALHPCHVESVAWIAERKDVLSASFGLLTLLAYIAYVQASASTCSLEKKPQSSHVALRPFLFYTLALLLFAFGLMSKPMLVTLPFVLLLLDFWPLHRLHLPAFIRKPSGRSPAANVWPVIWEKLPFFALSLASSIITLIVQHSGGAVSTLEAVSLDHRIANALLSYVRYFLKLIWPVDLAVYYPHPAALPLWKTSGAAFLLLLATAFICLQARKRPFLAVGWLWFVGTLVPVIGLVQVGGQSMADRYTYIPSIGLFIALTWAAAQILEKLPRRTPLILAITALALGSCALLTRLQVSYWSDSEKLFHHAFASTEENYMTHFCLGNALIDGGKIEEGVAHLRQAAQLNPTYPNVWGKLGFIAAGQGRFSEAVGHYRAALKCKPNFPEALNNLAWLLATCPDPQTRNGSEAVTLAERACQLNQFQKTLYIGTLGAAYAEAGRFNEAVATARRAHDHALSWGDKQLAERNAQLLALYQAGKPFHEPPPTKPQVRPD